MQGLNLQLKNPNQFGLYDTINDPLARVNHCFNYDYYSYRASLITPGLLVCPIILLNFSIKNPKRKVMKPISGIFMKRLLLVVSLLSLNFNSVYSQQESKAELERYSLQKTIDALTEQNKKVSEASFNNYKLNQLKVEILSNIDSLINKLNSGQDVSKEVAFYNDARIVNATDYIVNYESNRKLINSVFVVNSGHLSTSNSGVENRDNNSFPFRSSQKIYDLLTKEISAALLIALNSTEPEFWNQTGFMLTFGNSEKFRQYIDKHCSDIEELSHSHEYNIRGVASNVSNTGVLEDLYLMLSGVSPVDSLAVAETKISQLAFLSHKYLVDSYLFGLEVIKHNQLLYVPSMPTKTERPKIKRFSIVQSENKLEPDALQVKMMVSDKFANKSEAQDIEPEKEAEVNFVEKYKPFSVEDLVTKLNKKKNANYFVPYIQMLSTTESIVGDYANEAAKLSNDAQDEAYSIAEDAKNFSTGCTIVLSAASFISTAGIGNAAMAAIIGIGAIDETDVIAQEVENNVPAGEIVQHHLASIGLYTWMALTRIPVVSTALSKAPLLRLGISSYFVVDLGTSLNEIYHQRLLVDKALATGQISEAEAKLKKLDLLRSAVTTATFFAHTIGGLPAEIQASDDLIQQQVLPKVEKYIDKISDVEQQGLVLVQLSDGRVVPVGEKVKNVLDEYSKNFSKKLDGNSGGSNIPNDDVTPSGEPVSYSPDLSTIEGTFDFWSSVKFRHKDLLEGTQTNFQELLDHAWESIEDLGKRASDITFGKVVTATHEYTNEGELVYDQGKLDLLKEDIKGSLEYLKGKAVGTKLSSLEDDILELASKGIDVSHFIKLVPFIYNIDGVPMSNSFNGELVNSMLKKINESTFSDMETKYKDLFMHHQSKIISNVMNQSVQSKLNQIKNKFLQSKTETSQSTSDDNPKGI